MHGVAELHARGAEGLAQKVEGGAGRDGEHHLVGGQPVAEKRGRGVEEGPLVGVDHGAVSELRHGRSPVPIFSQGSIGPPTSRTTSVRSGGGSSRVRLPRLAMRIAA